MAVILLSGGLDSALNLALSAKEGRAKMALTMRYGQRAQEREISAARALAKHYGVEWKEVDISWLGQVNPTGLTRAHQTLPHLEMHELDKMEVADSSMRAVWVANRNGVFLNIAAAFAEAIGENEVIVGFNREEAATFPDNSAAYMQAMNLAFSFSTLNKVQVKSHTTSWDKIEILSQSLKVELPLNLVWSCYEGSTERCWLCESCKRSERALLAAGEPGKVWLKKLGKL